MEVRQNSAISDGDQGATDLHRLDRIVGLLDSVDLDPFDTVRKEQLVDYFDLFNARRADRGESYNHFAAMPIEQSNEEVGGGKVQPAEVASRIARFEKISI